MSTLTVRFAEPARTALRRVRSARNLRRRLTRNLRRRAGRARVVASLIGARLRGRPVWLLLSGSEPVSPWYARRLRSAAEHRAGAAVLVLDFVPGVTGLPASLPARRFWLDAAPGGGGSAPRYSTAGCTEGKVAGPGEGWQNGYYRDGKPVLTIIRRGDATIVEEYNSTGEPVRREEIDHDGRLIRIVDLHPADGREVTHRYVNADGECWLSVWVDPEDGTLGPAQQHRGDVREFPTLRAAQAAWVAGLISGPTPRILVSGRGAQQVAELVKGVLEPNMKGI